MVKARSRTLKLKVDIPDIDDQWENQPEQFPSQGVTGVVHSQTRITENAVAENLLYYDEGGTFAGVLNYFPQDIPAPPGSFLETVSNPERRFLERAGNFYVIVAPARQRKGIGRKLLTEAAKRWSLNFEQQDYTRAGASLVRSFLTKKSG
jgi:GNAT superfamily N-acetyltransferase